MKSLMKKLLNVSFVILIFCFLFVSLILAKIDVYPKVEQLILDMDEKKTGLFEVINSGNQKMTVTVEPENWQRKNNNSIYSWKNWLKISTESFILNPGESKKIAYTVSLPNNINKEVMAMIYFSYKTPQKGIRIKPRFGCALYVRKKGIEKYKVQINKVTISQQKNKENYYFDVMLLNTGNIHFIPKGYIIISDNENKRIAYLPVFYNEPLFPDDQKVYRSYWKKKDLKGDYIGKVIISCNSTAKKEENKKSRNFKFFIDKEGIIKNQ